jgi:hypothetical protein
MAWETLQRLGDAAVGFASGVIGTFVLLDTLPIYRRALPTIYNMAAALIGGVSLGYFTYHAGLQMLALLITVLFWVLCDGK